MTGRRRRRASARGRNDGAGLPDRVARTALHLRIDFPIVVVVFIVLHAVVLSCDTHVMHTRVDDVTENKSVPAGHRAVRLRHVHTSSYWTISDIPCALSSRSPFKQQQ